MNFLLPLFYKRKKEVIWVFKEEISLGAERNGDEESSRFPDI